MHTQLEQLQLDKMDHSMKKIRIEKITLNFGAGTDQKKLEKGIKLIEMIAGKAPVKTKTQERIPGWGLRPGLAIGCKITLRSDIEPLLKRLIAAKENVLSLKNFDSNGNISFGIPEYVDIPEAKYSPELGIIGFEVSVTLSRPGFRVKKRKIMKRKIPMRHRVSKEDAVAFMKETFSVKLKEEQDDL